jgi:hypothetical protein
MKLKSISKPTNLLGLIVMFLMFSSCEKNTKLQSKNDFPVFEKSESEIQKINDFIASKDYVENFLTNKLVFNGQKFNLKSSFIRYIESGNKKATVLYLAMEKENNIVGFLIACKVRDDFHALNNDDRYLLAYRDWSAYDYKTKSGSTSEYDLNENYKIATLTVKNGEVIQWDTFEDLSNQRDANLQARVHPCDANQDGNIGWGECYKCLKDACDNDPSGECKLLCDLLGFGTYCTGTIAASCAIISIVM